MAWFIRPALGPLLIIVWLLVLAACSSDGPAPTPTVTPNPTIPSSSLATLDIIQARAAELRGLEFLEEMDRNFMARDELEAFLMADLGEEDREDMLKMQQVMAVLGLIPQDADLYQLLLDLYVEQILGLYDPDTEQMYLIGDPDQFGPRAEVTLAHEYVHALQQQHFDIRALREAVDEDPEALDALTALIEGDAYLHSLGYISAFLTPEEREQAFQGSDAGSSIFDAAPYAVQQLFLFSAREGLAFVTDLARRRGQSAINDAFLRPPVTTEQVLHLEKYLQAEGAISVSLPDLAGALGAGWVQVDGHVLGEYFLRTYLETGASKQAAAVAAAGWGGGRYLLLEGPGQQRLFVALTVWDTEADAQEFVAEALAPLASVPRQGYARVDGARALLIVAPSAALVRTVRAQFPGFSD